jgi:hypothetical protein
MPSHTPHEAFAAALQAQPAMESTLHRWVVETTQAAAHRPAPTPALMYERTATLYALLADRAGWPAGRVWRRRRP